MRLGFTFAVAAAIMMVSWMPKVVEAQESVDPFLSQLIGTWVGEGVSWGLPSQQTLTFEWVLAGQFVRYTVDYTATGHPPYQSVAYIKPLGDGAYEITWMDTYGAMFTHTCRAVDNALTCEYVYPADGVLNRTVDTLQVDGTFETVTLLPQVDGTVVEAARTVHTRQQ